MRFTDRFRDMQDLMFFSYIKEKTGVELNFFANLQAQIDRIIERGTVENHEDLAAVFAQFALWKQTSVEPEKDTLLKNMLSKHAAQKRGTNTETGHSEVIRREILDGEEVVTVRVHSGPKRANFEEQVIVSPDGKRSLYVNQYNPDGRYPTTSVNISFPTSSGGIYQTQGVHPGVKAYWKDNNTVVIETSKELVADLQYHSLRSFDDTITVEYVVT